MTDRLITVKRNKNMKKTIETVSVVFVVIVGILMSVGILALYGAWTAAYVGVHLWTWFVVPVFNVATLTLPQSFGLSLLCHYWTYQHFTSKSKDERADVEKYSEIAGLILAPWVVLLLGWICHTFFMN